jgi:hypothetical protein
MAVRARPPRAAEARPIRTADVTWTHARGGEHKRRACANRVDPRAEMYPTLPLNRWRPRWWDRDAASLPGVPRRL